VETNTNKADVKQAPKGIWLRMLGLRWKILTHTFKRRHKLMRILLLSLGVALFWRGLYGLADMFLLPDQPIASMASSIVIGLLVLYIDDFDISELE